MGPVYLTGRWGLAFPFLTLRGIKKGCPSSPLLFCLLLSGVERRVLREAAGAAVPLGGQDSRGVISYADDIKLMAVSPAALRW